MPVSETKGASTPPLDRNQQILSYRLLYPGRLSGLRFSLIPPKRFAGCETTVESVSTATRVAHRLSNYFWLSSLSYYAAGYYF